MKPFAFVIAFLPFAAGLVHAGPILDPSEYEVVGQFELQQIGNEIVGDYGLTETDSANSYLVIASGPNGVAVGDFQLTESGLHGHFELDLSPDPGQYEVLQDHGNDLIGTYTLQQQGNGISGNYQLAVPTSGATAPEPSTLVLLTVGMGCLAIGRLPRPGMRLRLRLGSSASSPNAPKASHGV